MHKNLRGGKNHNQHVVYTTCKVKCILHADCVIVSAKAVTCTLNLPNRFQITFSEGLRWKCFELLARIITTATERQPICS